MPPLKKNFWGHAIPAPQSVLRNPMLRPHIEHLLKNILTLIEFDQTAMKKLIHVAFERAQVEKDTLRFECVLKEILGECSTSRAMNRAVKQRAQLIYEEIKPFLCGNSMLDIGCGNGLISKLAKKRFKHVQLLDVVNYVSPDVELPFALYREGQKIPTNRTFDTVLLLTVLHHSRNPTKLLKIAWKATKRRLIIIESVIGVYQIHSPAHYELTEFTEEIQIAYAAFVDWFYNRVLHDDIPVPYNFTTPEKWKAVFAKNKMTLSQAVPLGQDIEIGPEFHILFVLEK